MILLAFLLGGTCGALVMALCVVAREKREENAEIEGWRSRYGLLAFQCKVLEHELREKVRFRTVEELEIDKLLRDL